MGNNMGRIAAMRVEGKRRRGIAIRQALAIYEGRAKELERQLESYLTSGWRLERDLETLPESASSERKILHRLARTNFGRPLSRQRISDIAHQPELIEDPLERGQ
jgi:hypothetical protein